LLQDFIDSIEIEGVRIACGKAAEGGGKWACEVGG